VVETDTGALVPRAHDLLRAAHPSIEEAVAPELNLCQIETATPVCHSLDEVGDELGRLRAGLIESGRPEGIGIMASGTHPVTSWREQSVDVSNQRFQRMDDRYQIVARQQVICGCHVHVGIPDTDLAVATMSAVRPWLPVLLALSANSPFWQGTDTGFASYRMQIWSRWPTAVMPPSLDTRQEFDELVATLASIDAIEDATFLYWHIRPSVRWPTVEFRVCDTLLDVDHAVAVAGLVRALAWTFANRIEAGIPSPVVRPEVVDAAMWRAGRYGLDERLVSMRSLALVPAADAVAELLDERLEFGEF